MRQRIGNGSILDAATPEEVRDILLGQQDESPLVKRVRAPYQVQITDSNGNGNHGNAVDIYKVPAGMSFELRRFTIFMGGLTLAPGLTSVNNSPGTNAISLSGVGGPAPAGGVALLRSDVLIEWLQPMSAGLVQIPGIQTWSKQQGPFLLNGEKLQIQVLGVIAGLSALNALAGIAEGILTDPGIPVG